MLDPSANRRPLTSRVRLAVVASVIGLVFPFSVLQASMPAEVQEPAPAPQATSPRLIGIVTDNAGQPVAGATVLVSEAFTFEQMSHIELSHRNRATAESELNNEQNRFDQGTSTLRLVLEAQSRLDRARADELDIAMTAFGGSTRNAKKVLKLDAQLRKTYKMEKTFGWERTC